MAADRKESKTIAPETRAKIGRRIAALRDERDFTQADVARALGVTPQAVDKWEHGRGVPKGLNLMKLAELFKVSAEYIMCASDRRELPTVHITGDRWQELMAEVRAQGGSVTDLRRAWELYQSVKKQLEPGD